MKRTSNKGNQIGIGAIAALAGLFIATAPASAAEDHNSTRSNEGRFSAGQAEASVSGYCKVPPIPAPAGDVPEELNDLIDQYNELVAQLNEHMEEADAMLDELNFEAAESHQAAGGATGQTRRRADVVVEDISLTAEYEKAAAKLQEMCLVIQSELQQASQLLDEIKAAVENEGEAMTGQSRRRGGAVVEDLSLTAALDQAATAIEEAVTIIGEIGTEFTA